MIPGGCWRSGLALIAIGAGGIKPCVSAHVGDQFGKQNEHLIPQGLRLVLFFDQLRLDGVDAADAVAAANPNFGPGWAFGVPGVLMALATFVFWLGRNKFVHIPPGGTEFFRETFSPDGIRAMVNLIPLYLLIFPFFTLFDQTHSSWVEQAARMDCTVLGYTLQPSQIQAVNPILILLFIPIFSYVIYPLLGRWFEVTPLRKIGIGLFLTAASFVIIALAQHRIDAGQTPHIIWQLVAYAVLTAAEVMVSITALEFSYTQAPGK